MPAEDDILPAEEKPLPGAASPTTESPGYIDKSDPDEDPKEDLEDDLEEDLANYPTDGGDKGDDEDESFDDDEDDDIDIEGDEEEDESSNDDEDHDIDIEGDEEEDEYLALADSTAVTLPAVDHAPSAEETEPFETDEFATTPPPHLAYHVAKLRWRAERGEILEVDLPLRKTLCTAHTERGEGSTPAAMEVGYGIIDLWDDLPLQNSLLARMYQYEQCITSSEAAVGSGESRGNGGDVCYADTWVHDAMTPKRAASLSSIDCAQAVRESLASPSMRLAV
nr:hypothetical protein [Tanacetum cinerariifolium]